jgi:hypothetical protein
VNIVIDYASSGHTITVVGLIGMGNVIEFGAVVTRIKILQVVDNIIHIVGRCKVDLRISRLEKVLVR